MALSLGRDRDDVFIALRGLPLKPRDTALPRASRGFFIDAPHSTSNNAKRLMFSSTFHKELAAGIQSPAKWLKLATHGVRGQRYALTEVSSLGNGLVLDPTQNGYVPVGI